MRRITSDYILLPEGLESGVDLILNDEGKILEISLSTGDNDTEYFSGMICPGFVNAHCHSELSHLKGQIPEGTGMAGFIQKLTAIRNDYNDEARKEQIAVAFHEMRSNGIVAVGDICNDDFSFEISDQFDLCVHHFVEVFGFDPARAENIFQRAKDLAAGRQRASVTIHAPYSVHPELRKLVYAEAAKQGWIQSIHLLESNEERALIEERQGAMHELFSGMGLVLPDELKDAVEFVLDGLPDVKTLFVHLVEMTEDELIRLRTIQPDAWFCLCPRANRYIHGSITPVEMLRRLAGKRLCLGTDSLAGNWSLDVLAEIRYLQEHVEAIPLEEMLLWGTRNGAQFLGIDGRYGSLEPGKQPGILWLKDVDLAGMKLTDETRVERIF